MFYNDDRSISSGNRKVLVFLHLKFVDARCIFLS